MKKAAGTIGMTFAGMRSRHIPAATRLYQAAWRSSSSCQADPFRPRSLSPKKVFPVACTRPGGLGGPRQPVAATSSCSCWAAFLLIETSLCLPACSSMRVALARVPDRGGERSYDRCHRAKSRFLSVGNISREAPLQSIAGAVPRLAGDGPCRLSPAPSRRRTCCGSARLDG